MEVIHPTYLPFTPEVLLRHFAPIAGQPPAEKHIRHYRDSAARAEAFVRSPPTGSSTQIAAATKLALQMQKDERFWVVSALLGAFYAADRIDRLSALLRRALEKEPPWDGHSTWAEALGNNPRLYFEVSLPSPPKYKDWLAQHLAERTLVPYLLDPALASGKTALESATKADAVLVAPDTGFAVVFEAKVLSDASVQVTYDATRNQIARTLDVLLDTNTKLDPSLNARRPERSCFVLLTPQLFRDKPGTRLYGHLMDAYRANDDLLAQHLEHRDPMELTGVRERLGWLTWEECEAVTPGSCSWLGDAAPSSQGRPAPVGQATF